MLKLFALLITGSFKRYIGHPRRGMRFVFLSLRFLRYSDCSTYSYFASGPDSKPHSVCSK